MNKSALAVMLAFGLTTSNLEAASMGRINVLSALGQPLRAELELSADPQELAQMKVRLAPPSVFKQAEVPYTRALSSLRFSLEQKGDKPVVRVSSDKPIHDPFLDFLVEITWPNGSMVREYTFLLDPPDNTTKNTAVATKFPEPKEFINPPVTTAAPPPVVKPIEEPKAQSPMFVATGNQETAPAALSPSPTEVPVAAPVAANPAVTEATPNPIPTTAPTAAPTAAPENKPAATKAEKPAKTSNPASKGKTHTVQKGDTLGAIASEYLAADISLDQMLVSLFKQNPSAFEGQNINRLKSGVILTIPDAETAAQSEEEAKKTIRAHTRDWHAYRQKLAAASEKRTVKPVEEGSQTSQGSINTLKAEAPTPQAANQDQLKVSRSESTGRKPGVSEEDLIAKERALREAETRVAQLEKNISELQKLVEMKNQSLAALQQQAGNKSPTPVSPATVAPPTQPIVKPIPEIAPGKDILAKPLPPPLSGDKVAAELGKDSAPPSPAANITPGVAEAPTAAPSEAPTVAPTAAPTPAPTPVEEEDPEPPTLMEKIMGLINAFGSNPIYYGSTSGLLLALLGVIGWREHKRRKESARDEQFAALDPHDEPSPAKTDADLGWEQPTATVSATPDTTGRAGDDSDESEEIAEGEVDPVAEADVYIAYGREPQAEELLKDALKSFPQRTAIHSRLLDIYSRREAIPEFEEIAELLFAATNGEGEEWNKAVDQAAALGITSGVFSPSAPVSFAAADALDTIETAEPPANIPAENDIPEALDFEMPALGESATEANPSAETVEPERPKPGFDYASVDLNLGASETASTPADAQPNSLPELAEEPAVEEPEEVTTKLDLAQAYVEMGDTDGARELLNEVLAEGGPTQKAQAEKLLASLDK